MMLPQPHNLSVAANKWAADRQAHSPLPIQFDSSCPLVRDRGGVCNPAPGTFTQPLPLILPSLIPTAAAEPERHGREYQHD